MKRDREVGAPPKWPDRVQEAKKAKNGHAKPTEIHEEKKKNKPGEKEKSKEKEKEKEKEKAKAKGKEKANKTRKLEEENAKVHDFMIGDRVRLDLPEMPAAHLRFIEGTITQYLLVEDKWRVTRDDGVVEDLDAEGCANARHFFSKGSGANHETWCRRLEQEVRRSQTNADHL